jgi:hypothetical protein
MDLASADLWEGTRDTKIVAVIRYGLLATFSSEELIVHGVNYGHAGYTDMYKYKWTAERVDTIEYVIYQTDKDGNKTGRVELRDVHGRVIKVLPSVPKEYRKIDGYDWFTGNF